MIPSWKKQFSLKQLSLDHDQPITFILSQWQKNKKPNLIYLLYRWTIALIFLGTLVMSLVDLQHPNATPSFRAKWLVYLTNWGYSICTIQALLTAIMLTIALTTPARTSAALRAYKIYWLTNTIGMDLAFGITTIYWSLIYNEKTMVVDAMNILVHANNSLLMLIDIFLVAHPIRLLHCCYSMVFGVCYAVFSVIFYAAGGTSREEKHFIYPILDWSKPGITIAVCFAVLGFIVIIHLVCWGFYKFRVWLNGKLCSENDNDQKELHEERAEKTKNVYVNECLAHDTV